MLLGYYYLAIILYGCLLYDYRCVVLFVLFLLYSSYFKCKAVRIKCKIVEISL